MTDDLMNAILAMNAYDFGANAALDGQQYTQVGNWTIDTTAPANNNNFMAISYSNGSDYEIAYRGTTDVLGSDLLDGDFWNGWTIALGYDTTADVNSAISFYQSVLATVTGNGGTKADITLTGHSLGGGLAGLVGSIYGVKGYLFDNEPYEQAALNAYTASLPGPDQNAGLATFIYGTSTPTQNDESQLSAYATLGEPLSYLRSIGPQTLPVTGLDSGAADELGAVQLHSMALASMLLYASDNNLTNWSAIAPYWMPELWNDDVANAAGVGTYKTSASSPSTALEEMIAYSAIDEGTLLYGDVAIQGFFDDATDLASLVPSNVDDISSTNDMVYRDLSQIAIQYAGHLAADKSTDASLVTGIASSSNGIVSVNLDSAVWDDGQNPSSAPQIIGAGDLVRDVIMSTVGSPVPEDNATGFQNLFGSEGDGLIAGITEAKAASSPAGVTLDASDAPKTFAGGQGGAVLIGSPNGNTSFIGGGGTNIMLGQASDSFDLGVGNNFILEQNSGTATLDASTATSPTTAANWNMVESGADGAESFVFQSANLAPLTIVYGASGSDTFDFEAGASDKIGVYILQMNDINQANFLALDPSKIDDYITQNFGSTDDDGYGGGFDDKIVLINPTASDILKYNGQIINDPTSYKQVTTSQDGGESTLNPNTAGGPNGMGERHVDPNNYLKLVGDGTSTTGTDAYYTDAWNKFSNTFDQYGLKSGDTGVNLSQAYSNDYQTVEGQLTLRGLTANQSTSTYPDQSWDGTETDSYTSYYDSNEGDLSLIGFNPGDFGLNFANNSSASDFKSDSELFGVSEWSQATVWSLDGLPDIIGVEPASLGASLGTSSTPFASSQYNIVSDDSLSGAYNRPSLTASDFMRAA